MQRDAITQLRVPPHSIEAESAVLGSLLQDNAIWDKVADLVGEGDFYRYEHRLIFDVVRALMLAGKAADILTVSERLKTQGKEAEVGLAYLQMLTDAPPSRTNARRYAEIVRDHSVRRRLVAASDEICTLAFNPGDKPVTACLDIAQQKLHDIHIGAGRVMPTSIAASVASFTDRLKETESGSRPRGLSTGFPMLDRMLGGGFKGGKQIILAARPSIGKSSLAEQFCLHLARHEEAGAAFFSQEMTKDELTDRAIANIARVQLDRIIAGRLEREDRSRLNEAIERIRSMRLYFDDQPALTLTDIAAKARMVVRQHGVKLIVIDYIQLCGNADGGDEKSRHHQIEQLSRGIKTLAKQLDVTFLTLSQLNREVEKRTTGRPVLSDLKESGSIEEDADVVMLLSRGPTTASGLQIVNCDVPKNRQGRTGSFSMMFEGPYQQWSESAVPVEWKASTAKKSFTEEV